MKSEIEVLVKEIETGRDAGERSGSLILLHDHIEYTSGDKMM
jgi:hypothetical protein